MADILSEKFICSVTNHYNIPLRIYRSNTTSDMEERNRSILGNLGDQKTNLIFTP
jgi:hypothetical protein